MASTTPVVFHKPGDLAYEDRGTHFRAFCIVMLILSFIAIAIRFYWRLSSPPSDKSRARIWWDDWAFLASTPLLVALETIACIMVELGFGKHIWNVPGKNLVTLLKLYTAIFISYNAGIALTKAAALLFYQRIFHISSGPGWLKLSVYILHAINICWFIGIMFGTIFWCTPVVKDWDPLKPGKCGTIVATWLASSIPSAVMDLLILILPLPLLWSLKLSLSRKVALTFIFVTGYSVIIVSLGRVISVSLEKEKRLEQDMTYDAIPVFYWSAAEIPVILLCICLPTFPHIARRFFTNLSNIGTNVRALLNSRSSQTKKGNDGSNTTSRNNLINAAPAHSFDNTNSKTAIAKELNPGLTTTLTSSSTNGGPGKTPTGYIASISYDAPNSDKVRTQWWKSGRFNGKSNSKAIHVTSTVTVSSDEGYNDKHF